MSPIDWVLIGLTAVCGVITIVTVMRGDWS